MSIFSKILAKILPGNHVAAQSPASTSPSPASPGPVAAPPSTPLPGAGTPGAGQPGVPVDVEAVLAGLAAKNPGPANWRSSIVDLMKLLELDSDLASRKELAKELGYSGDTNDSATMNIWLHKQVMRKLAENGGKVPPDLKD